MTFNSRQLKLRCKCRCMFTTSETDANVLKGIQEEMKVNPCLICSCWSCTSEWSPCSWLAVSVLERPCSVRMSVFAFGYSSFSNELCLFLDFFFPFISTCTWKNILKNLNKQTVCSSVLPLDWCWLPLATLECKQWEGWLSLNLIFLGILANTNTKVLELLWKSITYSIHCFTLLF